MHLPVYPHFLRPRFLWKYSSQDDVGVLILYTMLALLHDVMWIYGHRLYNTFRFSMSARCCLPFKTELCGNFCYNQWFSVVASLVFGSSSCKFYDTNSWFLSQEGVGLDLLIKTDRWAAHQWNFFCQDFTNWCISLWLHSQVVICSSCTYFHTAILTEMLYFVIISW